MHSIEKEMMQKSEIFRNKNLAEIKQQLNLPQKNNKASYVTLSKAMLDIDSNKIADGLILKTIRLTSRNIPAESMSFMPVDFDEWLSNNDWHQSTLYKYFSKTTFAFMIFQEYSPTKMEDQSTVFKKMLIWKMDDFDLDNGLKEVWSEVRRLISEDKLHIYSNITKTGKVINKNNLPKLNFNYLGHLRPGGKKGDDVLTLPNGKIIAKQRFWLNKNYINEIIKEERRNNE